MSRKVLEVLSHSAGGIAKHVATVQRLLDGSNGLIIDVAAPAGLPVAMPRDPIHLEIPRGPLGHGWAKRRLARLVAERGYDVVHAHGLRAGMDAGAAARDLGALRVVTVHNLVRDDIAGPVRARFYRRAEKLAVSENDRVLAVSRDIARHLESSSPASNIEVFHLGVDPPRRSERSTEEVRAELGVPSGAPVVVSVARLDRQKALHVLIDAIASLDGVTALVVGTGPLHDELSERAVGAGVGDRFRLLGWREDVSDIVAASDVFCLSSIWEGVPLAAQEAMLLGTPVVATAVGGMPELIEDGATGLLVPASRPDELAGAIESLLNDPGKAEELARVAQRYVAQEFSVTTMADRLRALYSGARDG